MGLMAADGIPYLWLEIHLLYKSGPNREKDVGDLIRALPHMLAESIEWLLDALRTQHPGSHEWIGIIEEFRSRQ